MNCGVIVFHEMVKQTALRVEVTPNQMLQMIHQVLCLEATATRETDRCGDARTWNILESPTFCYGFSGLQTDRDTALSIPGKAPPCKFSLPSPARAFICSAFRKCIG